MLPNSQVSNNPSEVKFNVREAGSVRSVRECVLKVEGLPSAINGQIVELKQGGRGMIMGFNENDIQVLILNAKASLRSGDEVYSRGESLHLPVGDGFLGRIVNALCEPLDNRGAIKEDALYPVFRDAPAVMDRVPLKETLETGTLLINAVIPIAKGQRQLLIGDRLTGKTTIAVDAIINQKGKDVICVYCCIGKTQTSLMKLLNLLKLKGALEHSIVVSAVASCSMGEQYLAPYTAAMLGEYFMYKGKSVLVVFDDLTRHAWVYRQICLLMERPPGREAYPGDIFYLHSQLVERAAHLKPELGSGSMTFLPICEILQGDVTGYVSSNLISMTDGQIYFNIGLFNKGIKPAIDFGLSVSRIGSKAQWPAMKALSERLKLEYIQYQELVQMTQLRTTGLSKEAEEKIKRGQVITQLLIQDKNRPLPMEGEISLLFALSTGVMDSLPVADIKKFKYEFLDKLQEWYPEVFLELRKTHVLGDVCIEKLYEALGKYFQ